MASIRINGILILGAFRHWKKILFILAVTLLLVVEEINHGYFFTIYMNRYSEEITYPITAKRPDNNISIGIVIVLSSNEDRGNYELALDTVSCYATLHGYNLYTPITKDYPQLLKKCGNKDFMFLRHCLVSLLSASWSDRWLLFLDADMAVLNPNHLIEEYVDREPNSTQIVFYERIMNYEVMAGSYLFRNDDYARRFLMFWSKYEFKVPKSFHGTDNGAIHSAIVEFALPDLGKERKDCEKIWKKSKDFKTLSHYEICIQNLLVQFTIPQIKILSKGRVSWARDGWLTNNVWSPRDFIFHAWQKQRLNRQTFARWDSPLVNSRFDMPLCETKQAFLNWRYKDSFIVSDLLIDRRIHNWIENVQHDKLKLSKYADPLYSL